MEVPEDTPVTTPVKKSTVEIPVLLLVHVPPPATSLNVVVKPAHTLAVPVIDDGNGLTVTTLVAIQPVAREYVIVDVPANTPVTTPVEISIVAIPVLPLVHAPPPVASLKAVVKPAHTVLVPVMGDGNGLTVTTLVAIQPVARVYVIADVPEDNPVTTPVEKPIVAIPVLPLVQVPPPASLKVVVNPAQTAAVPVIDAGNGLTVTTLAAIQPVARVYVITEVPDATPVTTPVEGLTVAIVEVLLVHVPLPVASLNVVVKPTQTVSVPVIDAGNGLTVTTLVAIQPVARAKVIVEVPDDTPVTIPVEEPTVAIPVLPLVHVPPLVTSLKVVVIPAQTTAVPLIDEGNGFTVTTIVAIQPVESV